MERAVCNLETFVCVAGSGEKRKSGWSVNARKGRPRWRGRGSRSRGLPSKQFTSTSRSPSGWHNKRLVSLYCLFFAGARVFNDLRPRSPRRRRCRQRVRQMLDTKIPGNYSRARRSARLGPAGFAGFGRFFVLPPGPRFPRSASIRIELIIEFRRGQVKNTGRCVRSSEFTCRVSSIL